MGIPIRILRPYSIPDTHTKRLFIGIRIPIRVRYPYKHTYRWRPPYPYVFDVIQDIYRYSPPRSFSSAAKD